MKREGGKYRIVYVELKQSGSDLSDRGPAWIGRAEFSKTGRTIYFNGRAFQSLDGHGIGANYHDIETGDQYWISGVKKNRQDRHWAGSGTISVDEAVLDEYLEFLGIQSLDPKRYSIVKLDHSDPRPRIYERENRKLSEEDEQGDCPASTMRE